MVIAHRFCSRWCLFACFVVPGAAWIDYPPAGSATMTHYDLPPDYVAACGCTPSSTHYPTAALSQMAFGSSRAYGPACGQCFQLTLINPVVSDPPFHPNTTQSIVVKVTDMCPMSGDGWCSATDAKANPAGQYLNFDLAFPSKAIPEDFFPSDVATYGFKDFGVWNVHYEVVPCRPNWTGSKEAAALGSVTYLGRESVCCPADPTGNANDTCPSYSDQNGLPPNTFSSSTSCLVKSPSLMHVLGMTLLLLLYH